MTSAQTLRFLDRGAPHRRGLRALAGALAVAVGITLATCIGAGNAGAADGTTPTGAPVAAPAVPNVRIVQANMDSPQSVAHFQADVRTVLAQRPDFITYNEVAYRQDSVLAPGSYDLWRTPGKYTGETAVAWNSAVWQPLAHGTWLVSNRPGVAPGQKVPWGIRYANWVTLENSLGQVVSVISAHTAPKNSITDGLLLPSVRRIGALAAQLGQWGPVLVGGDFNVGYHSAEYPRDLLTSVGLTPTYDVLGSAPPTGDHYGATIDYVFLHTASQFTVGDQFTHELYSDHDLLGADLRLGGAGVGMFKPGIVWSNPPKAPSLATRQVIRVLNHAPAGVSAHVATRNISGVGLVRAIVRAHRRGVNVQLITATRRQTALQRGFVRMLGHRLRRREWAANVAPKAYNRAGLPPAGVLVSLTGGTPAVRVDLNRRLTVGSQRAPMRAQLDTSLARYNALFTRFFKAIGRTV